MHLTRLLLIFFISNFFYLEIYATHIRAGEIIARRISNTSLTYEFTIIGYTDTGSDVQFGGGKFNFGDGNLIEVLEDKAISMEKFNLENQIALNLYKIVHTFQAPGRYVVSYFEQNRNDGILNMSNSVDTPFFIETELLIDPFFGLNNTPVLLIPPIDNGAVAIKYIHNPGAYDPDGDSLSYELVIPKQEDIFEVGNYRYPNATEFYDNFSQGNEDANGPPTFTLDSLIGDLVWDAPGKEGEYNFAFRVVEWRKVAGEWFKLGHVTRDMQVIIEETNNERPIIEKLPPLCVEVGTLIRDTVDGSDPDGDRIKMEAFGGPFEFLLSPAKYFPYPPDFTSSPSQLFFEWQTECSHIRKRAYEVEFKITDFPNVGPKLVDFSNWKITVVPSAPTGLIASLLPGRKAQLNWDPYSCDNAEKIEIWRRIGSYEFEPEDCEYGLLGYELIAENSSLDTDFIDDNLGKGLAPGSKYCYRLIAEFPLPEGGTSYASEEVCVILEADAPVMTNVSVEKTEIIDGEIIIAWHPPLTLDVLLFPKPYKYKLRRYDDFQSINEELEFQIQQDTFYIDNGLNTKEKVYNYQVEVFDNNENSIDFSAQTSLVRLEALGRQKSINLTWKFKVPWTNDSRLYPMHYIYRNNVDPLNADSLILIDSTNVITNGFKYSDDGAFNGIPLSDSKIYCYYIITSGTYENDKLPKTINNDYKLLNKSQIICSETNDLVPPCPPMSLELDDQFNCTNYLVDKPCELSTFENKFNWTKSNNDCADDIKSYNIYYLFNPVDSNLDSIPDDKFELIANTNDLFFTHKNLSSFKGCYYVTALDRSNNESDPSDIFCRDNCPYFELPNIFTPNADGKNDLFTPFYSDGSIVGFDFTKCPRFVSKVSLRVVNRAGVEVFLYNSDDNAEKGTLIKWDGRDLNGDFLSSGVYYYNATITYDVLDFPFLFKFPPYNKNNKTDEIKGWLQILK